MVSAENYDGSYLEWSAEPELPVHESLVAFVLARAVEDERRQTESDADEDRFHLSRVAQMMVHRMLQRPNRMFYPGWINVLRRYAENHEDHPDYRPEWRPTRH